MTSPRLSLIRNLVHALRLATRPGGPSLAERLASLPRLVRSVARGEYAGATTGRLLLMVAALGWLLSPVDLVPEAVLGVFGLVDDAMVASWLVAAVVRETEDFLSWERSPVADAGGREGVRAGSARTVPGHVVS